MDPTRVEISAEDLYRIIGELEVLRRKQQEIIQNLVMQDKNGMIEREINKLEE